MAAVTRRPRRLLGRALAVLVSTAVATVLLLIGTVSGAQAHAYLAASNPADGATLTQSPAHLSLSFSEHVVLGATRITLTDGDGRSRSLHDLRLVTRDLEDTEEPAQVVAPLPALGRNTYRLSWETLSSDDLHRTSGVLVFGVRTAVTPAPLQESHPSPVQSLGSALLFSGVALALGGLLARRVLSALPGYGAVVARRWVVELAFAGAVLAAIASLVLPVTESVTGGLSLRQIAETSYGSRWGIREAGLLLLLLATWASRRAASRRAASWRSASGRRMAVVLGAGAGLASVGAALLGHAGAGRHLDLLRVAATAAHLVAALTWVGALACLALVLVMSRLRPGIPALPLREALRGFAVPAGCCVAVAVVTGVYLASHVVVSLDAAVTTIYGRTLLLKLLLAGAAGALALANHRRLRRSQDYRLPRRTVVAEAAVGALLVLVTAVLTNGQPATEPQLVDAGPRPTAGPLNRQVADLQESVDVRPNRPGPTVVLVDAFDTRRPAPEPVTAVTVRLGHGRPVAAVPLGDGHWSAPVRDVAAGTSRVHVTVTRGGAGAVSAGYRWTTDPAESRPSTVVSRAPIRDVLTGLSALLAVVLPLGWALLRLRRRRGEGAPPPVRAPGLSTSEGTSVEEAGDPSVTVS